MKLRIAHQIVTRLVVVGLSIVVAVACVSSSDRGTRAATHACFVECGDVGFFACSEGPATETACTEYAQVTCDTSLVQSMKVDDCTCDSAACAPGWYPTEPDAPACDGVLECNAAFSSFLDAVPACRACLKSACAQEVDGCGPNGLDCAASIGCFAEPLLADFNSRDGTCVESLQKWPAYCYFLRDACAAIRDTEPAGMALGQCLMGACVEDCFPSLYADACSLPPPSCSTLSAGG